MMYITNFHPKTQTLCLSTKEKKLDTLTFFRLGAYLRLYTDVEFIFTDNRSLLYKGWY